MATIDNLEPWIKNSDFITMFIEDYPELDIIELKKPYDKLILMEKPDVITDDNVYVVLEICRYFGIDIYCDLMYMIYVYFLSNDKQKLCSEYPEFKFLIENLKHTGNIVQAAEKGLIFTLEYMYPIRKNTEDSDIMAAAASGGHINCMKFLFKNGCKYDCKTYEFAALNGHLNCLKYAKEIKCEIYSIILKHDIIEYFGCDYDGDELTIHTMNSSCLNASKNGHLDCLKWLVENKFAYDLTKCLEDSFKNNHFECFKFLIYYNSTNKKEKLFTQYVLLANNIDCYKYMVKYGYEIEKWDLAISLQHGYFEIFKYVHEQGIDFDENGAIWDGNTLAIASLYNNKNCFAYAIENNCPNERSYEYENESTMEEVD